MAPAKICRPVRLAAGSPVYRKETAILPPGTVTFLFTDIEGSTQLWEQHPEAMKAALARHDAILRQVIEANRGYVVKTTGDGCHAVFETAISGVIAALTAQQALYTEPWDEIKPQAVRVRIALHTGEAEVRAGDYYGPAPNRAARLMSIAHGGQILLSTTTADLARHHLPAGATLLDLGEHRLKDLIRPERVFQLAHPALPADFPALQSLDAFPNNLPVQLTSFVGRTREMAEAKQLLSTTRLLTLIGPGGTGNTRLAVQPAAELLPSFADGVWLAELAPRADPALVLHTISSVFELREVPGLPLGACILIFLPICRPVRLAAGSPVYTEEAAMNPLSDLNVLMDLARERQAQMRREARIAHASRSRNPGNKEGNARLRRRLTLALIGALLVAVLFAQLVAAV